TYVEGMIVTGATKAYADANQLQGGWGDDELRVRALNANYAKASYNNLFGDRYQGASPNGDGNDYLLVEAESCACDHPAALYLSEYNPTTES
ncbi:hypothetical protein, partial [Pseudomonas sp. AH2 (2023)]|uniref:hypothetical protein n=1 Tax=Pseudomonas sp. AH2 (2023) TaxID=3048599 RepID=UPI002B22B4F3